MDYKCRKKENVEKSKRKVIKREKRSENAFKIKF